MSQFSAEQPSQFISTRKAAARLGVSLSTVQLWVESGKLPAWKTAGGHRRIPKAAVELLVLQQQLALQAGPSPALAKLLVVEDDAVQLALYRQKLSEWGLPVQLLTASNGFDGLLTIGRESPDLLITDLRMPGIDGVRMIRSLQGQQSLRVPYIIVVAALTSTEIEEARQLLPGIPIYPKPAPYLALRMLVEHKLSAVAGGHKK